MADVAKRAETPPKDEMLVLAEILRQRDRLEDLWHRQEQAGEGGDPKKEESLHQAWMSAKIQFDYDLLNLIKDGAVDGRLAARAALSLSGEIIDLNRTEYPELVQEEEAV